MSASRNSAHTRPLTSSIVRPASVKASCVKSAHCSIVNCFCPVYFRTCGYSAIPTIAASPTKPKSFLHNRECVSYHAHLTFKTTKKIPASA